MANDRIILNRDLSECTIGDSVCVTGIVAKRWGRKSVLGISLDDITGRIVVSFRDCSEEYNKGSFAIGKRVRISATVDVDKKGVKCLRKVTHVEFLEEINELSNEMDIFEQESLVMLSKICGEIRNELQVMQFIEVNTRLISRRMGDEILEPLLAEYPGFGTPAFLSASPSAQLSEFLAVTLLPKVFTQTISFTTSYRFPNGSTEIPIIMAKAINLSKEEEKQIILGTLDKIMSTLSDKVYTVNIINDEWKTELETPVQVGAFSYSTYSANIPTIGQRWNSMVELISRLEDDKGNLLVESSTESLDKIRISTITYYPSQFLNWISKAPKRQLLNLWTLFSGGNIYG